MKIKHGIGWIMVFTLVALWGCAAGPAEKERLGIRGEENKRTVENAANEEAPSAKVPAGARDGIIPEGKRTDVRGQLDGIPSESRLTVRGGRFELKHGLPVVQLTVYVDGRLVKECDLEGPDDGVCVDELAIEPGAHSVMIWMLAQNPETLSTFFCPGPDGGSWSCSFYQPVALKAGLGEHLVIDASKLDAAVKPMDCYTVTGGYTPPANPCIARLLEYAIAPSCTSRDLADALSLANDVREVCSDAILDSSEAMALMMYAEGNHFHQNIRRCYDQMVLKRKIPPVYIGYSGDSFWPPRTRISNSWDWARNPLPGDHDDGKRKGARQLEAHISALEKAMKRLPVVEALFAAFIDDANQDPMLDLAVQQPWSLDPTTVEGHRNFVIMRSRMHNDGETASGKAYLEFASKNAIADESLHCGIPALSGDFVFMLLSDGLSREDYNAVKAMIRRTPLTESLGSCGHAFNPRQEGAVPIEERLRWLAAYECSTDNRHKSLLGSELRSVIRILEEDETDAPLANALKKEYSDCLKW
jgi:hypothetical protein